MKSGRRRIWRSVQAAGAFPRSDSAPSTEAPWCQLSEPLTLHFGPYQQFDTGGNLPSTLSIGDLDDNGTPDLAVANRASNTVGVLLNQCNIAVPPAPSVSMWWIE